LNDVVTALTRTKATVLAGVITGVSAAVLTAQRVGARVITLPFRIIIMATPLLIQQDILNQSWRAGKWSESSLLNQPNDRINAVICEETEKNEMACTIPNSEFPDDPLELDFQNVDGQTYVCNNS
jgi:hypothetical protein